jgi:hypothetical protein
LDLLVAGVEVDAIAGAGDLSIAGMTALHIATQAKNTDMVECLLEAGADVNKVVKGVEGFGDFCNRRIGERQCFNFLKVILTIPMIPNRIIGPSNWCWSDCWRRKFSISQGY